MIPTIDSISVWKILASLVQSLSSAQRSRINFTTNINLLIYIVYFVYHYVQKNYVLAFSVFSFSQSLFSLLFHIPSKHANLDFVSVKLLISSLQNVLNTSSSFQYPVWIPFWLFVRQYQSTLCTTQLQSTRH